MEHGGLTVGGRTVSWVTSSFLPQIPSSPVASYVYYTSSLFFYLTRRDNHTWDRASMLSAYLRKWMGQFRWLWDCKITLLLSHTLNLYNPRKFSGFPTLSPHDPDPFNTEKGLYVFLFFFYLQNYIRIINILLLSLGAIEIS